MFVCKVHHDTRYIPAVRVVFLKKKKKRNRVSAMEKFTAVGLFVFVP